MRRRARPARPEDLERMQEIEERCFAGPERLSPSQLAGLASRGDVACIVAEVDGRIEGFAMAHMHGEAARLLTIDVDPDARRLGIGRLLLRAAEREGAKWGCASMGLEVRVTNHGAISLYESAGYIRTGRVHGYYPGRGEGPEDALEMEKPLSKPQRF
jgi:ribosomal-protein-alanine N-acetyltransferase